MQINSLKILLLIVGCIFTAGCDSTYEKLDESVIYGHWRWIQTIERIMGGQFKQTPESAGYEMYMEINISDTIKHYRNDTLIALSVIQSNESYVDHIDMIHSFIDSLESPEGYQIILFPEEKITYENDTLGVVTLNMSDYIASSLYSRLD